MKAPDFLEQQKIVHGELCLFLVDAVSLNYLSWVLLFFRCPQLTYCSGEA